MNESLGNEITSIAMGGGKTIFEEVIKLICFGAISALAVRIGIGRLLVERSYRFRLGLVYTMIALAAGLAVYLGVAPWLIALGLVVTFSVSAWFILSGLSGLGVLAAFPTTTDGLSASDSLRLVKSSLIFLGTGGNKLSDSQEFGAMLQRVKSSGGSIRLLLSSPENVALKTVAQRNQTHDLTYQNRVKESIRVIFTKALNLGINCEIRLYSLDQVFALPHFRLFFADDTTCLFSQLVWNENEGGDNPQLVLRKDAAGQKGSLYLGYKNYFESLWGASSTVRVDQALIDSWA